MNSIVCGTPLQPAFFKDFDWHDLGRVENPRSPDWGFVDMDSADSASLVPGSFDVAINTAMFEYVRGRQPLEGLVDLLPGLESWQQSIPESRLVQHGFLAFWP